MQSTAAEKGIFTFSASNFSDPQLPRGLKVLDVPCMPATEESLQGYGQLISSADELSVDNRNFEIVPWPAPGRRPLDPLTGDEAGTTEGEFQVHWEGDYFFGHNLAIASENCFYLDGLGAEPERAMRTEPSASDGSHILLWMSDYHPDGGQLFWPLGESIPFTVCLGLAAHGDDIRPEHMRAFRVPAGKGIYLHPSTWHNGVYVPRSLSPRRFLTRQGRVHARISASWVHEFGTLLRVPLV